MSAHKSANTTKSEQTRYAQRYVDMFGTLPPLPGKHMRAAQSFLSRQSVFNPYVRLNSAFEAVDRCIAARIACVVVALP